MRRAVLALALLPACVDPEAPGGGAAIIADDKTDDPAAIEVVARLAPGTVDAQLTASASHLGYVIYAAEGARVTLEVTRTGSSSGLDTVLNVYGPRLSDGRYPTTIASDDDAGYGALSKLTADVDVSGFYLVELATPIAPASAKKARLKLSCEGTCVTDQPVAPLGNDLRWFQRAAERKALSLQAYQVASARVDELADAGRLAGEWGVVLDLDETVLDNSAYQRARADLGLGYSARTWTAWVAQQAAPLIPGAAAFLDRVREHGGKIAFVTNRVAATECAPTEANLAALGVTYDRILCKSGSSDKNARFQTVAADFDVLLYVGDNIQDFPSLTQELRKQPDAAFAAFGDTYFIVPNPMYGSWEKNVD